MIKAVVVDLDDTLCMTEAASFALENAALAKIGRPPMSREIHKATFGQHLFEVIKVRSPGVDVDKFRAAFNPTIAEFIADGRLDSIPPENFAALDRLTAQGKDIMLLTSRNHSEFKHILEPDHPLAERVKAFYYRDNMQYHKPDPRAFDDLLKTNGVKPNECVYVGDALSDAQAASSAGLHFIACLEGGLKQRADFIEYQVDAFVDRFPDVVQAIADLDRTGEAAR